MQVAIQPVCWEYQVANHIERHALETVLFRQGRMGWELVAVKFGEYPIGPQDGTLGGRVDLIFKRPYVPEKEAESDAQE